MRHPNYKQYLHLIQEQVKRNLTYSFAWLSTLDPGMPEKIWKINRRTLERARNTGELICCSPTSVLGCWFLDWVNATENERRAFANRKIFGRYWPQQRSRYGVNKDKAKTAHANA